MMVNEPIAGRAILSGCVDEGCGLAGAAAG
jgi:hypothetical protein